MEEERKESRKNNEIEGMYRGRNEGGNGGRLVERSKEEMSNEAEEKR